MLERPDVAPVWDRFVYHPFVMAMGDGTLPPESFKGYLVQDYLYLVRSRCVCGLSVFCVRLILSLDTFCPGECPGGLQVQEYGRHRSSTYFKGFVHWPKTDTPSQAAGIVLHIDRETSLHLTYCEGFGMSREDMEKTEEKMACTAYTRYTSRLSLPRRPLFRQRLTVHVDMY